MKKYGIPLALCALLLASVSCGNDEENEVPTTGSIGVITVTIGADIDADGYTVAVDGVDGSDVGANSSVTLPSLAAGTYSIGLLGIALNCQPATNPQSVDVVAGQTASAQFDVTCVTVNQTPVADAGPTQTLGDADDSGSELVTLNGSASTDADGTIASWSWHVNRVEIGTGETLTLAAPVGVHTVSLTVTDDGGSVDTDEVSITVEAAPAANQPPVANAGPNQAVVDADDGGDELVTLDGSSSTDGDGTIASWSWSENSVEIGTGQTLDSAFDVGIHPVTLTVTDDEGATDTDRVIIAVVPTGGNVPPVADAGPNQTVEDADDGGDELVTLDGSFSTDSDGTIESWIWSENSVEIGTGQTLSEPFDVGVHTVTLTVTDDQGATDTDRVRITVDPGMNNQPPVADAGQNQTVEDVLDVGVVEVTLDGSLSSDPDGTIKTWIWSEDGVDLWPPGEIGTWWFGLGEHTVTLTVTDDEGATNSDEVTITVNGSTDTDVGITCKRDECRFDQDRQNECQVFLNECLASSGDNDDDECVAAALLMCRDIGRD
jgi:hypothetical protein